MALTCDRVRELVPGYVLGALEPAEMAALRGHLDGCSNAHEEVRELGGILPYLAIAPEPAEPPRWLRESVMAAAAADLALRRGSPRSLPLARPEPLPESMEPRPDHNVVSLADIRRARRRLPRLAWLTRVAAALAVLALAGYAVVVQADLNRAKEDQQHAQSIYNALGPGDARTISLTDEEGMGAGGLAVLRPNGHLIVSLNHLASTHGNQIYTVWLTGGNGVQVKVGSFYADGDGTGFLEVDNMPTSASLWISVNREPGPAVTKPTGPTILSGTISL